MIATNRTENIVRLLREGLAPHRIALIYKITPNHVMRLARTQIKEGGLIAVYTSALVSKTRICRELGLSTRTIARSLGVCQHSVMRYIEDDRTIEKYVPVSIQVKHDIKTADGKGIVEKGKTYKACPYSTTQFALAHQGVVYIVETNHLLGNVIPAINQDTGIC